MTPTPFPSFAAWSTLSERFGDEFRRIESVAETDGRLRVLDLKREQMRDAVRTATDAKGLYRSDVAAEY